MTGRFAASICFCAAATWRASSASFLIAVDVEQRASAAHHGIAEPIFTGLRASRKSPHKSVRARDRHRKVIPAVTRTKSQCERTLTAGLGRDGMVLALVAVVLHPNTGGAISPVCDPKLHVPDEPAIATNGIAADL